MAVANPKFLSVSQAPTPQLRLRSPSPTVPLRFASVRLLSRSGAMVGTTSPVAVPVMMWRLRLKDQFDNFKKVVFCWNRTTVVWCSQDSIEKQRNQKEEDEVQANNMKCCVRIHQLTLAYPDPYINTGAGTMSLFEHCEVVVLDDTCEVLMLYSVSHVY
ncbi:hypothetical protein Rs2_30621 [Raphanus sativus]|nr:hypothetical protein Rs2_30621 [Raphanus sativus]